MSIRKFLRIDESLGLSEMTLIAASLLPRSVHKKYRYLSFLYSFYLHVMVLVFMSIAFVNILITDDFFTESIESAHFTVAGIHLYLKQILFQKWEKRFQSLFQDIRELWSEFEPKHKKILDKHRKSANKSTIIVYLTMFVMVLSSNVFTVIKYHKLPLQLWIPEYLKENFILAVTVQLILHASALTVLCATTSFLVSITDHVCALGEAFESEIYENRPWDRQRRIECYKYHSKIVRLVIKINNLVSVMWAVEVVCSSVQITLPGYRTMKEIGDQTEFITHAFILAINISIIYLIFGSGNKILELGDKLHTAIYSSPWYDASIKEQKEMIMMQIMTGNPMAYRYKWLFIFNRPKFTSVLQATYSYLTLLRFFDSGI